MSMPTPPGLSLASIARPRTGAIPESARDQLRRLDECLATRGASSTTAKIYRSWARRFLANAGGRHPDPRIAIERFLADLRGRACSTSSQRQALAALGFLFREVHGFDATSLLRRHRPAQGGRGTAPRAPTAPDTNGPDSTLVARLAAASGRSVTEILSLRIGDIDLERGRLRLRRDGVARRRSIPVPLPPPLREALMEQIGESWRVHQLDFFTWLDHRASPCFAGARLPTEVFRRKPLFPGLASPAGRGAAPRREGFPATPVRSAGGADHVSDRQPPGIPAGRHASAIGPSGRPHGLACPAAVREHSAIPSMRNRRPRRAHAQR